MELLRSEGKGHLLSATNTVRGAVCDGIRNAKRQIGKATHGFRAVRAGKARAWRFPPNSFHVLAAALQRRTAVLEQVQFDQFLFDFTYGGVREGSSQFIEQMIGELLTRSLYRLTHADLGEGLRAVQRDRQLCRDLGGTGPRVLR